MKQRIAIGLVLAACGRTHTADRADASASASASAPAPAPAPAPASASASASAPAPACVRDADCVPSACCHARTCGTVRPRCEGVACTMSIEPGTLDMGRCVCRAGQCAAEIREIPPDQLPR